MCLRVLSNYIQTSHLHLHFFKIIFVVLRAWYLFALIHFLCIHKFISFNCFSLWAIMLTITWRFIVFYLILHCLTIIWFNFHVIFFHHLLLLKSLAYSLQICFSFLQITFMFKCKLILLIFYIFVIV
jgi:hypothetical protein